MRKNEQILMAEVLALKAALGLLVGYLNRNEIALAGPYLALLQAIQRQASPDIAEALDGVIGQIQAACLGEGSGSPANLRVIE